MTESVKLRNLKVVKKQEIETETETGISTKYVYMLQDEDKEDVVTIKTVSERHFELGDTLDVFIGNQQTRIDDHANEKEKEDGGPAPDLDEETEQIEEIERELEPEPDIKTKKGAIKKARKSGKKNPPEAVQTSIQDEGVPAIPPSIKEDLDKPEAKKPKSEKDCKWHYRGGLCANSKMDKPFCVGMDKCPEHGQGKIDETPKKKKEKKDCGCGNDPEHPLRGFCNEHGVKEKKGSPKTPSQEKEKKPKKPKKLDHDLEVPSILIKKKDFPKDILGGLLADVKVELHTTEGYLYAHAKTKKTAPNEAEVNDVCMKLLELSGIPWTYIQGNTFNADKKQLNKEK